MKTDTPGLGGKHLSSLSPVKRSWRHSDTNRGHVQHRSLSGRIEDTVGGRVPKELLSGSVFFKFTFLCVKRRHNVVAGNDPTVGRNHGGDS